MSHRKISFAILAILLPLAASAAPPRQQASDEISVVEAARRAREAKAKGQAKPAKVVTDEDVPSIKGIVSVVGEASTQAADADAATPGTPGAAKPSGDSSGPKDEAYWRGKFDSARKTLANDARELDVLQRELNLKQQQYYSDPNVALREQNSRGDIDDSQKKIDDKKAAVEKDKADIAALEDEMRKSGGDAAWAREENPQPLPEPPPSDGQPKNP